MSAVLDLFFRELRAPNSKTPAKSYHSFREPSTIAVLAWALDIAPLNISVDNHPLVPYNYLGSRWTGSRGSGFAEEKARLRAGFGAPGFESRDPRQESESGPRGSEKEHYAEGRSGQKRSRPEKGHDGSEKTRDCA